MESVQKKYDYKKRGFQSAMEAAVLELEKDAPSRDALMKYLPIITRCQQTYLRCCESLLEAKQRNNEDLDALTDLENEQNNMYGDSECIIARMTEVLDNKPVEPQDEANSQAGSQNLHRLPKLELPKFGGEARDWLQFWSGFQTIHDDDTITPTVKFQYLSNCMVKGSQAQELVSSYPISTANYKQVIQSLQERFGREEMLVEVYVRDLIALILENAHNKTTVSFSSLYVKLSSQLRALASLGVTTSKCAAILYPMVESALPEDIFVAWERNRHQNAAEATESSEKYLEKLLDFLKHEVEGSERIRLARQPFSTSSTTKQKTTVKPGIATAATLVTTEMKSSNGCEFCEGKHSTEKCCKAMSMSIEERRKLVQDKHLCFACLKPGHGTKKCKESVRCLCCGKRHPVILCPQFGSTQSKQNVENRKQDVKQSVEMCNQVQVNSVLFQTVLVRIVGKKKSKIVRAMFDTGSQASYVLTSTANEVGLQKLRSKEVIHLLFGGVETQPQKHNCYNIELRSTDNVFTCKFEVQDSNNICLDIPKVPTGKWLQELSEKGIVISDIGCSTGIEMLLGSDVYGRLLTGEKHELKTGPVALKTKFGWTISGKLFSDEPQNDSSSAVISYHVQDVSIQDLWNLDLIGIKEPMKDKSKEDLAIAAMDHFRRTVIQKPDGRYVVHLPWIEGHSDVPDYRYIATKKLESTTARLRKLKVLDAYHAVFSGWEEMGIIERTEGKNGHYLSHHGVIKQESTTTPVRPVFNASFKTKGNPSLNDCLEIGPNLLEEIPAILTRFRLGLVGVSADIEKAFLQIEVDSSNRDFLRFLWYRDDEFTEMQDFRHCRVVFGVSSSPFLLAAVLKYHLDNCEDKLKTISDQLQSSFYVDNCLVSVPSIDEALHFKQEASKLLATAKMNLRCWEIGPSEEDKTVPVLGLSWKLKEDTLECDLRGIKKRIDPGPVTRRKILSVSHTLFDPIGFSCPVTIIPKMLLQRCHTMKGSWDSEVVEDIAKEFQTWCRQVEDASELKIPRCLARNQDKSTWTLNTFTDSSQSAYAAVVYLRSGLPGDIQVELVMARSRVAPIKGTTIPRLELLGCLCGARLTDKVKEMLGDSSIPVTFHTDSTTALAWIKNEENWSVFVSGRVKDIRKLSDCEDWIHVPGKCNPADIPSRGSSIRQLVEDRWWEGPHWLKLEKEFWPASSTTENEEEINQEKKKMVVSHLNSENSTILSSLRKFGSYRTILRILVFTLRAVKRFLQVLTRGDKNKFESITSEELLSAEIVLVKLIQKEHFPNSKVAQLKKVRVYTDNTGILRIKTKLFCGIEDDYSCPVVLPSKEVIIHRLIWRLHFQYCHVGVRTLMTMLREKYWILRSRRTIRSVVSCCVKCRRFRGRPVEVEEGPMPRDRVRVGAAFDVTGVDMAGPLITKGKKKVWICIFTCATYRGIHLELCGSLTTETFLLALRRFVARRGRPSTIYSDNGLNFVGCHNLLKKVDWSKIEMFAGCHNIKWKFNPPTACWWGGFWERMIGIVKQLLRSVLGSSRVTNEELNTLLCDVESVVNNRPLTYVDEDEQLVPLTPYHFLNNCGTSVLPDVDAVERDLLLARYKNMQHCRDEMRSRFKKEYLSMLVHNGKQKNSRKLTVGDVVLVGSDIQKRINWPMGVVTEVMPGKDGHVRVVRVKTANGILLRPVQKLYPLEVKSKTEM